MRARNIKPGFYKSDQLAECSIWARYIFPGLWMLADRKGRIEYRPKKIKAELLPFDNIEIEPLLIELEKNNLIKLYTVENIRYIWLPTFLKHQSPHNNEVESIIPPYIENIENSDKEKNLSTKDKSPSNQGEKSLQPREKPLSPESLIPSSLTPDLIKNESLNLNTISSEQKNCSEQPEALQGEIINPEQEIFIKLPLIDGSEFSVTKERLKFWYECFPAANIEQEFRTMKAWLFANKQKRKTQRGINGFIQRWLAKAQDNPRNKSSPQMSNNNNAGYMYQDQYVFDENKKVAQRWLEREQNKQEVKND